MSDIVIQSGHVPGEFRLDELEKLLGYEFKNKSLLARAMTHSSYANERKINFKEDYERLEFLGDAVLELTVSEFLYNNYPTKREGEMTRTRAALVCEPTLSECARQIGLPDFLMLGKGEEATGGRKKDSILCDAFEATAGALYLDGGFKAASGFINKYLLTDWENKALFVDSKTILQEKMQKMGKSISYRTVSEEGTPNERIFVEELLIDGRVVLTDFAGSKKGAQQKLAFAYLKEHSEE